MLALEQKLPAILKGDDKPADVQERLLLAQMCQKHKKLYAAAARFYAEALDAQPKLARDPGNGHRYNAACAAALAGCGQGQDAAPLDDKERTRLRQQARDWLQAALASWDKAAANPDLKASPVVLKKLQHWQTDTDLAGVRDQDALAKLPAEERKQWLQFWSDVEAVRQKANPPQ
jgi:hypothetical protein